MRTGQKVNRGGAHGKQEKEQGCQEVAAAGQRQAESQGKRERDQESAEENDSVQAGMRVDGCDQCVIEPLPRVPGLAMHGGGKGVGAGDGVGRENQFSVADMPASSCIVEQTGSEGAGAAARSGLR